MVKAFGLFKGLMPAKMVDHLSSPLFRNAYSLVVSSGATSALGLLYWWFAARYYSTETVGINSAVITSMTLIASIAQFNLVNALNRFLPRAGHLTRRMIVGSYLFSVVAAILTGSIFLLGIRIWSPTLGFLLSDKSSVVWFVLSIALWCLFSLQDGVFVGLRQAGWVPISGVLFALSKIVLLVAWASLFPSRGIYLSWTAPLIVLIILANILIHGFLIPRHTRLTQENAEPISVSQLARFVLSDYFSSLIWMATVNVIPIIVVERMGASENAFFYLPWMITYTLYLVSRNMGMSYIAEASADRKRASTFGYQILLQNSRLLIPVVLLIVLGAPLILHIYGKEYTQGGTVVLRLLVLSAIPYIVNSLYVSIARVQRRMAAVVITLGSMCLMVLAISSLLIKSYGITAIGIGWLFSQTLIALILVFTKFRTMILGNINFKPVIRFRDLLSNGLHRLVDYFQMNRYHHLAQRVLETSAVRDNPPSVPERSVQRIHHTPSDSTIFILGRPAQSPAAVLSLFQNQQAWNSSQKHVAVLNSLRFDDRLGEIRHLMPFVVNSGKVNGYWYRLDQYMPGVEASQFIKDPQDREVMLKVSAATIAQLHRPTVSLAMVSEERLGKWIYAPLDLIRNLKGLGFNFARHEANMKHLADELVFTLQGSSLPLSWVHGDYWPGNILMSQNGSSVIGILDWDQALPDDLPVFDLINLLLSVRMVVQRRELGDILRELLAGGKWSSFEKELLDECMAVLPGKMPEMRTLLLLYWLRHVHANLTKTVRYSAGPVWVLKNVEAVLLGL